MTNTTIESQYSPCQICDVNEWATVREGRDLCRPEYKKVFRLTGCAHCGHVMQNPKPDGAEIGAAYSIAEDYAAYRAGWKEKGWPLWKVLRTWTMNRRVSWLKQYGKGKELLDVGCGAGDFMEAAHREGWTVRGIDYNSTMVDMVSGELGFEVKLGELRTGIWEAGKFDAVSFFNVLEHVPDPLKDLTLAAHYLHSGGCVLMQFPSRQGAVHGQWYGQYWAPLDLPRHLHFYDENTLALLCKKAGCTLVAYKTPIVQSAWCYYASSWRWSNRDGKKALAILRFMALASVVTLILPFIAFQALRGQGMEAVAIAVKN